MRLALLGKASPKVGYHSEGKAIGHVFSLVHTVYCRFTISTTVYVTVTLCIVNDAATVLSVTCDLPSTSDAVGVA